VRKTEGGIECRALGLAELARTSANGPQQLVQPRERQVCLRLNTVLESTAMPHSRAVRSVCQEPLLLEATQQRRIFVTSRPQP